MNRASIIFVAILAAAPADARAQIQGQVYVTGVSLPVAFAQDPSDPTVQFIVEQGGLIRVVKDGVLRGTPFLDLTGSIACCGERGLLGMALDPAYAATGRFFVNFTNPSGHTVVARFKRSAGDPLVADAASRFDLLWSTGQRWIEQPFVNHNGGTLEFGPDGHLYIGMGDGGSGNDPFHHAQNPDSLLGKMLRVNVNVPDGDAEGFDIPADNPYRQVLSGPDRGGLTARPEIWSFGLRNPWKFSFDSPSRGGNGALIIGDVGQSAWEEINYQPAGRSGRNYGWRNYEGSRHNVQTVPLLFDPPVMPAFEYDHTEGSSVNGGYVYRGAALPAAFQGRYFFADFSGRVWSLRFHIAASGEAAATDVREHTAALSNVGPLGLVTGFGMDAQGELYVLGYLSGQITKIVPTGSPLPAAPPTPAADFNGDLKPDILWHHQGNGYLGAWLMDGLDRFGILTFNPAAVGDTAWKIVATPRANADFKTDIVWQHETLGTVVLWTMNGTSVSESTHFEPSWMGSSDWRIVASGDIDNDGKSDLVWRHRTQGWIAAWLMNGLRIRNSVLLGPGLVADQDWVVAGTGDFNKDGRTDLLWQHRLTGLLIVWIMDGAAVTAVSAPSVDRVADTGWVIAGIWDYNRDGSPDLLWHHRTTGAVVTWPMNGLIVIDTVPISPPQVPDVNWRIVGPR